MTETKITIVQEKVFETIQNAVNRMVDFIKPTYGPAINKMVIDRLAYRMVVDDGVQGARDYEITDDPAQNAIVKIVKEVAIKTNDRVGDGTTSSLIMLQAIISEISRLTKRNGYKIEMELKKGLQDVKNHLLSIAKPIKSREDLKKVALISYNNEKIADIISGLYHKLGKDAVITIDKSQTMETTCEMSNGVKIPSGYVSQYMVTNPQRMETVLEKPYILITDYRLTEAGDIVPIMEKMLKEKKNQLIIIAENIEGGALATANVNIAQGKFFTLAVCAPQGEDRKVFLEDLALLTGAKVFSESKGDKLENAELSDLGRAGKFICRQDESIVVQPKGKRVDIATSISDLRIAINSETNEKKKDALLKRLGLFTNTIAVIKVGAATDNEQKALKYKVEDAVNAVRVAFRSGVVCGAGLSLTRINTSSRILNEALKYPHRQLLDNMGIESSVALKDGQAFNVITGKTGEFMSVGVVDPVEVLIAGVESAVSIASVLVTVSGIIVESSKETK